MSVPERLWADALDAWCSQAAPTRIGFPAEPEAHQRALIERLGGEVVIDPRLPCATILPVDDGVRLLYAP